VATLQVVSDIHTEFFASSNDVKRFCKTLLTDADVLVIAGDLGLLNPALDVPYHAAASPREHLNAALDVFCNHYTSVIFVPGNHEFYYYNFTDADTELKKLQGRYLNLATDIDPFTVTIQDGIRIHGATLWFEPDPQHVLWWRGMNDAYIIGEKESHDYLDQQKPNSPAPFEQRGQEAVKYLMNHAEHGDIIISHHLPLWAVVHSRFKSDMLTHFFVNEDAKTVIRNHYPKLWICGHTHGNIDRTFPHPDGSETRILCNPHGYKTASPNKNFNRSLTIEV